MMHYFFVTAEQTDKLILGVEYTITFEHIFPQGLSDSILFVVFCNISIETSACNRTAFVLQWLLLHTILFVGSTVTVFLDTEKSIKQLSTDTSDFLVSWC